MKFNTLSKRIAATGAATALATGVLVAATGTAATAATAHGSYDCSAPGGALGTFPMTLDVPGLEEFPQVPAGFVAPVGFLSADSTLGVPVGAAATLTSLGVVGGAIDDFVVKVGDVAASTPLTVTSIVPSISGAVVSASGLSQVFTMPAAGSYDVSLPQSFTFVPTTAAGPVSGLSFVCVTQAPASLGQIETTLNDSVIDATAPRKIKKGKKATIASVVTGGFSKATGDVVAMKGNKTLGQGVLAEDGTSKFKIGKLKRGVHTITVKYLGDGFRKASFDTVKIKVTK